MGTRGFIGFVVNDTEKITYNHYDSYPSGVGVDVLAFLRAVEDAGNGAWKGFRDQVEALAVVDEDDAIEAELLDRAIAAGITPDTNVGARFVDGKIDTSLNWYQVLRETQGSIAGILKAGVLIDSKDFPLDSLFCEWGYLVNLDGDGSFEVYRGFQKSAPTEGRWAGESDPGQVERNGYYAVQRVASWPLAALPDDKAFLALEDEAEEEV